MSIRVLISNEDSEVLEDFRVVCLEGENNATADRIKNVVECDYDIQDTRDEA